MNNKQFIDRYDDLNQGYIKHKQTQYKHYKEPNLPYSEELFWNRVGRDPYFMYVENSLELADPFWVDHNRKVISFQEQSTKSNEEEIIETNGNDYALHAIES